MSNKNKKWCVVPKCSNTSTNAPEKLFFTVPLEPKSRRKWMYFMKRADPPAAKSHVYCCEDHFDIESDMESYVRYKLVGGKLKLKKGVVPHKFECQKLINEKHEKSAVRKRNQDDPIPSTPDMPEEYLFASCNEKLIKDSLNNKNNKSIKKSTNHKAVQVRLKNKVKRKATITEEKYSKNKNNTDKKPIMHYKQQIDRHSISSFTDTSSVTSEKHNMYEKSSSPLKSDEIGCEETYFKEYMEKSALNCISKEPQLLLGEVGVPSSISQMDTATEGHIKTEPMDDSEDMSMYCDKDAQTLQHKTHIIDEETYSKTLKCCVCGGDIVGFRYTCVECIEFSLCGACEANARHGQHYVLRVPESKPMAEVQSVLATIRQHLFKDMDIVPDVESTLSIKSEMDVKQEDITIEEHVLDDMPRNTSLPTAYMDDHNYSAKEDAVSSGDIKADMGTTGAKEMAIHTRNEREGDSEHPTILPDDGSTYDVPTLPAPSTAKRKLSTQDNTNVNNGTNNKENRLTMVCVPAQSRPMIEINAGNIVIPTQSNAKPVILVQLLRTPKEASVNPPDT